MGLDWLPLARKCSLPLPQISVCRACAADRSEDVLIQMESRASWLRWVAFT